MEGSSRNIPVTEDLDSTVIRHTVERYFHELQQDADLQGTPLDMNFLGFKRKTANTSSASASIHTPAADPFLPKRIRFDASAVGDNSILNDMSIVSRKTLQDSLNQSQKVCKVDQTAQWENKLAEKQARIVELQQKIIQMEMKLKETETMKGKLEFDVDSMKDFSRMKTKHLEEKIEDLQTEIRQLIQKNEFLSKENVKKAETLKQLKLLLEEQKLAYDKEAATSEQKLIDIQSKLEDEVKKLKRSLEDAIWEASKRRAEVEEVKEQLKLKEKTVTECNHQVLIEQQQQVIVEMENALFAQRTTFAQSQEAKLAKIPQMEKEILQLQQTNKLLRETAANEELLKEKISSLEDSVQRLKERNSHIPSLEAELKKIKDHLYEWEYLAQRLFDADSMSKVRMQVDEMRRKELKLVEEVGNLRADLNSVNRLNASLKEQVDVLKEGTKNKSELEDRVRKLERKLAVVQKDRDHYRLVNEMYEREMTHVGGPAVASMEAKQVQELEKLLDEYRAIISAKDATPRIDDEAHTKVCEEKEQLVKQVGELNQKIENLELQLEFVSSKTVAPDTQVLHFTNNPLDMARRSMNEKLVQLEKDNESLRERIRLMEAGQTSNLTLLVGEHFEQGCTPERLKELEEKLKLSELKYERVEEVFKKYCSDFRRGVFELFGYQVDKDECGNFKLISVYAESSSDYLMFKYVGDGLIMMDTPYVHTIDDFVQLHLNTQKCIPAFLSALTIELFSRQSINVTASTLR